MNSVLVYDFDYFDRNSGAWQRAPDSATREAIREMDVVILPETEKMVPDSQVARSGLLRHASWATGWPF
ncbi:MAG: hypothetical protein ABIQ84_07595 [Usitatibacter sp.]